MARLRDDSLAQQQACWQAQQLQADCRDLYTRYLRADRIISARQDGWSHRLAMREDGGRKEGAIQAYDDQANPHRILSAPYPKLRAV